MFHRNDNSAVTTLACCICCILVSGTIFNMEHGTLFRLNFAPQPDPDTNTAPGAGHGPDSALIWCLVAGAGDDAPLHPNKS